MTIPRDYFVSDFMQTDSSQSKRGFQSKCHKKCQLSGMNLWQGNPGAPCLQEGAAAWSWLQHWKQHDKSWENSKDANDDSDSNDEGYCGKEDDELEFDAMVLEDTGPEDRRELDQVKNSRRREGSCEAEGMDNCQARNDHSKGCA